MPPRGPGPGGACGRAHLESPGGEPGGGGDGGRQGARLRSLLAQVSSAVRPEPHAAAKECPDLHRLQPLPSRAGGGRGEVGEAREDGEGSMVFGG